MERKPENLPYAGFWSRAAARVIDVILILAAYELVYIADRLGASAGLWADSGLGEAGAAGAFSLSNLLRGLFFLLFPVFYYVYLHGSSGQTFGKMAMRIRVVNEDGTPLDYPKAFVRWLGYFLCDLTFSIGYVWAAFDARKQGLHDKVCGTLVLRTDVPPPVPESAADAARTAGDALPPWLDSRSEPPI